MPNKNIAEILIRRYVYANESRLVPKMKFKIVRCSDTLASGYVSAGDKDELAKAVKEAKLHYPTEAEIESLRQAEVAKREREIKRIQLSAKSKPMTGSKKRKKTLSIGELETAIVEIIQKDGKVFKPELPEVPEDKLFPK